jgi:hypothetical protein
MNKFVIMAMLAAVIASGGLASTAPNVFATSDRSDNANNFGEGASDAGQEGKMGDHASDPDGDGVKGGQRSGIGNVLNQGDPKDDTDNDGDGQPDSKHPGDLADFLGPIP